MLGAVVSTTVTSNEPLSPRPPPSVTVQLTVVVPREKVEPEAGAQVGVGATASSSSVAVAFQATVAPAGDVASACRSAGRWIVGGVLPMTLTWKVIALLPVRPVTPNRDHISEKR